MSEKKRLIPREALADLLDSELEQFVELMREAMKAKKRVRQNVKCPHGQVFRAEFTTRDFGVGLKAAELLLDRVEGRPGTQQPSEDTTFVLENKIGYVCDDCPHAEKPKRYDEEREGVERVLLA